MFFLQSSMHTYVERSSKTKKIIRKYAQCVFVLCDRCGLTQWPVLIIQIIILKRYLWVNLPDSPTIGRCGKKVFLILVTMLFFPWTQAFGILCRLLWISRDVQFANEQFFWAGSFPNRVMKWSDSVRQLIIINSRTNYSYFL